MPRKNRSEYVFDNCVVHARLQINNGEFHFSTEQHFKMWKKIALIYLIKYPTVKITGYIWMSNHCHLMMEVGNATDLSNFMHDMAWRYAWMYNKLNGRKGHFFQQRFRCSVIDRDEYEKIAQRYIYRNQIRAGMVKYVGKSKWSSYAYYAYGKPDSLITPFRTYASFGLDKKKRMEEFRQFVETMTVQEEYEWKQRLSHPLLKSKKDIMKTYLMSYGAG